MLQNITMSKGGAYSLATRGAADVINASIPMIEQALSGMELRGRTDFSVADMGCADGGTSLQMIETMIEQIREEAPEIPIKVHYTDQPRNDYNGLIQTVLGLGHFPSYIEKHKNVFQFFSELLLPPDPSRCEPGFLFFSDRNALPQRQTL